MYSPLTPLLPVLFRQRPCGPLLFWIFYLPHSKRPDKPGAQGVAKKFYASQKFLGMPLAPCGEGAGVTMGEGKNRKRTPLDSNVIVGRDLWNYDFFRLEEVTKSTLFVAVCGCLKNGS